VVESDTLKEPGSLAGYIKLLPGDEPDKIIAIVMGSNEFNFVGTDASFSMPELAEGEYWVKFFSTLDKYSNLDTNFTITAGESLDLPDSIVMPLKIPVPTGFTLNYDTLKQIVTLTWNSSDPNLVKGYNIYRKHSDSDFVKINTSLITDTTFSDSSAIQDETYNYKIAAVDGSDNEGTKSENIIIKIL